MIVYFGGIITSFRCTEGSFSRMRKRLNTIRLLRTLINFKFMSKNNIAIPEVFKSIYNKFPAYWNQFMLFWIKLLNF